MNGGWFRAIYRAVLRLAPVDFRRRYGDEAIDVAHARLRRQPRWKRPAAALYELVDLAVTVRRERRGTLIGYVGETWRDVRYAWRGLTRSPGFALVGVLSMGLGIGLTTVVYHSKWELLSRELPAANARRLVMPEKPVSYADVERYRDLRSVLTGVAAVQIGIPFSVTFSDDTRAEPQRVFGQLVSADYFSVLGVQPQRGRVLSTDLDRPGAAPAVVITDRFWRNRLGASPDAVGRTLHLNGQAATIVGITPENFNGVFPITPAELFVPITVPAALAPELANDVLHRRTARDFQALICLAPGVTLESAEAALDAVTRHLDEQDPSAPRRADAGRRVTLLPAGTVVPLPTRLRRSVFGFFAVLMALIMTIACMNLANLLLARGANRRKELAIRLSIGAGRFRLVRQMLTEGIVLSLLGGLAGFLLAYGIAGLNARVMVPRAIPTEPATAPDWRTAVFAATLALVSGVGLSVVPALRATKADLTPALKDGSAATIPRYLRFGLRNMLIVVQMTGSVMLLLITGFLIIGLSAGGRITTGVDPRTIYLLSIDPVRDGYAPARADALFDRLGDELKAVTGVRRVATAAQAPFPLEDEDDDAPIRLTTDDGGDRSRVQIPAVEDTVGADYFAALGIPVMAGREFVERDRRSATDGSQMLPAVLNESAARGLFQAADPIGRRVRDERRSYEVVGVVADLKRGLGSSRAVMYLPLTRRQVERPPADGITVVVQADPGTDALGGIRRAIASSDPGLRIFNERTFGDYLDRRRSSERFALRIYGGIGLFGLALAAVGLAGVTAYAVAQRRREIGIRIALGARRMQVLRLVLHEGVALVTAGTVLGLLGAFGVARLLSSLADVFVESLQIGTSDLRLLAGAPLLLATVAVVACYLPARRASAIDPLDALRDA